MCTLVAWHRVHRELPLVVAANRDELLTRPSSGPQLLAPGIVGGRDEDKGGTWLGASARGFFVGLTNQRLTAPPDPSLRSRGEVVLTALGAAGVDEVVAYVRALDARRYNSFNLLFGDARALWVAYARRDEAAVELAPLDAGIWALPNDRIGSRDFPRADRALTLAAPLATVAWDDFVPRAQAMLADHEPPQPLCVHLPGYGTRSATLLGIGESSVERYLHADGPPCQAPLVARDDLVAALRSSR